MTESTRRDPRYPVEVAAEVTAGGKTFATATQNISEGGVALLLDDPLEEGASLRVTLLLTQDGIEDPEEEAFDAKATVAWATPREGGGHTAGVRFSAISPKQRDHLRRFLAVLAQR
jgi:c-di-GMP-binding flagellar brake protein YcgR